MHGTLESLRKFSGNVIMLDLSCLIIHTLYPHLYRIQFKDAAVRDHKSSQG